MLRKLIICFGLTLGGFFFAYAEVHALPVSASDLWQNATIQSYSSQHSQGPMTGFFDGNEGGYRNEVGNALFADHGGKGTIHSIEWSTSEAVTVKSFNLTAYHDFEDFDIRNRGFSKFSLYAGNGSDWTEIFTWEYSNPNDDLHYGGGPSHNFSPDTYDMNRSYLELAEDLAAPVTSQFFRAEFTQYETYGPRIVELDGYSVLQAVPEPTITLLLCTGLAGLAGTRIRRKFRQKLI